MVRTAFLPLMEIKICGSITFLQTIWVDGIHTKLVKVRKVLLIIGIVVVMMMMMMMMVVMTGFCELLITEMLKSLLLFGV